MTSTEKTSAFFNVQKRRVETVGEAFKRFSQRLSGDEMVGHVADMLEKENSHLVISIVIRPDSRTVGCVVARMKSEIVVQSGEENLYGLNPDPES